MWRAPDLRNVVVLSVCQALFVCSQTTLILLGGLVGYSLADDKSLATLPVSAVILGTAAMTIPASLFMRRVGRRLGFMTGAGIGVAGALTCSYAIAVSAFLLFCLGAFVLGCYNAFCQYYRFAAADAVLPAYRSRAISFVLAGGIVAAVAGPELATATRDLVSPVTYLGSFLVLAVLAVLALILIAQVRIPRLTEAERRHSGRPLGRIMRQPAFVVAVLAGMIAYAVMSLVMTATPLAMIACDYRDADAGFVIEWHVLGMFAPSFVTGHLIARFGLVRVMLTGAALLAGCAVVALAGIAIANFWAGLVMLGVGWNFLFIGATTLLTEAYLPAERAKVQAANDFLVFGATATASFLSGKLLHAFGWSAVNMVALPFALAAALAVLWLAWQRRSGRRLA